MLRIAHVSLGLDVGGQERLLVEFARHADRTRFQLTFLSLSGRGKIADVLEDLGWHVVALEQPPGFRPRLVLRLARALSTQGCAVVHTHDDRPLFYGALAVKMARLSCHIHTHHHGLLPQMSSRQRRLAAWAGRLTDAFVCVSHDSARHMADSGLPPGRITTVWNGIDLEKYSWQGPCPGGAAVTVARLSAEKDIATLLRAAAFVVETEPAFRLEIAGDGPLRPELQELATALNLDSSVRFLGEVGDVAALLGRAAFFVLPSKTEGISLTILEAMARGLPVVATTVGGNPEVVQQGSTGFLVPPGDPRALADALLQCWHHPEEGRTLGLAGRRRVEAHFDSRSMVAQYERLYLGAAIPSPAAENAIVV